MILFSHSHLSVKQYNKTYLLNLYNKDYSRSLFFPGEISEFMQVLFRENIVSARERLRSTLAIPSHDSGALFGSSVFSSESPQSVAPAPRKSVQNVGQGKGPDLQIEVAGGRTVEKQPSQLDRPPPRKLTKQISKSMPVKPKKTWLNSIIGQSYGI